MKDELLSLFADILPSIDFEASDTLVSDGIISSVDVVQIVGELSMEYGVNFVFEDLTEDNFNSIDAIAALVESKL